VRKSDILALLAALAWATVSFAQGNKPPAASPVPANTKGAVVQPGGAGANAGFPGAETLDSNNPVSPSPSTPKVICAIPYRTPGQRTSDQKIGRDIAPTRDWLSSSNNCRNNETDPTAGLNDTLYLLIDFGSPQSTTANKSGPNIDNWRLSINGIEIPDGVFRWFQYDESRTTAILSVKLARTDASKAAWNELLAQEFRSRIVPVTIIDDSKKPIATSAAFHLEVLKFSNPWAWALLAALVLLIILLLTNDRWKDLLRDDGPVKNAPAGATKAAYSLARVQMFYWFCIVLVSFTAIWTITGDRDTVNNDVLALIGISSGTLLGAAAIDSSKKSQAQSDLSDATTKLQQTQANAAALTATVGAGQPATIVAQQAATLQQQAVGQLNDRTLADYNVSFLTDILSDEDGLSFHRFQMFSWSLVLGVIFVASVVQTLAMPTLGNTLLGLMGISGGTYLGFKFPEQKTQ
jgi:hypothetical protein